MDLRLFAENYPDVPYRLVDESVAAAISYGSTRAGSVVCVVDFGGGTLDVSVVRMPESFAGAAAGEAAKGRVLGKAGAFLGGDDIDRWLLEDLLMRAGRTAEECEEILPQLTTLARQIKEELSAQSESSRSFLMPSISRPTSSATPRMTCWIFWRSTIFCHPQ